jgi:hypothetical protein
VYVKGYGVQMAEQYVDGSIDRTTLFDWAWMYGRTKYDPKDTETLYIAVLILNLRSADASPEEVQRELVALLEPSGGEI